MMSWLRTGYTPLGRSAKKCSSVCRITGKASYSFLQASARFFYSHFKHFRRIFKFDALTLSLSFGDCFCYRVTFDGALRSFFCLNAG